MTIGTRKPIPVSDELSEPFWAAVNEQRLVIQRCQTCKTYHHPPASFCPICFTSCLAFEEVSGRGTVRSYTITYDARQPAFQAIQPYAIAVVELEEQQGLYMLSNIPDVPVAEVRIGMAVQLSFEELAPGSFIPQFVHGTSL
jgi:uncharacterized OB-fold protein